MDCKFNMVEQKTGKPKHWGILVYLKTAKRVGMSTYIVRSSWTPTKKADGESLKKLTAKYRPYALIYPEDKKQEFLDDMYISELTKCTMTWIRETYRRHFSNQNVLDPDDFKSYYKQLPIHDLAFSNMRPIEAKSIKTIRKINYVWWNEYGAMHGVSPVMSEDEQSMMDITLNTTIINNLRSNNARS